MAGAISVTFDTYVFVSPKQIFCLPLFTQSLHTQGISVCVVHKKCERRILETRHTCVCSICRSRFQAVTSVYMYINTPTLSHSHSLPHYIRRRTHDSLLYCALQTTTFWASATTANGDIDAMSPTIVTSFQRGAQ